MALLAKHPTAGALAWPHGVEGVVRPGAQRARQLGFPTANLDVEAPTAPEGVYAGWVGIDAEAPERPAMIYVGSAPTFGPADRRVEVHLFDFSGDLYGRRLCVRFGMPVAAQRCYASPVVLAAAIRGLAMAARDALGCRRWRKA